MDKAGGQKPFRWENIVCVTESAYRQIPWSTRDAAVLNTLKFRSVGCSLQLELRASEWLLADASYETKRFRVVIQEIEEEESPTVTEDK